MNHGQVVLLLHSSHAKVHLFVITTFETLLFVGARGIIGKPTVLQMNDSKRGTGPKTLKEELGYRNVNGLRHSIRNTTSRKVDWCTNLSARKCAWPQKSIDAESTSEEHAKGSAVRPGRIPSKEKQFSKVHASFRSVQHIRTDGSRKPAAMKRATIEWTSCTT